MKHSNGLTWNFTHVKIQIQNATQKRSGRAEVGLLLTESKEATIILPLPWDTRSPERNEKSLSSRMNQGSKLETGISSFEDVSELTG